MSYLPATSLPATLWRKGKYYVSRHLQSVYVKQLTEKGLLTIASTPYNEKKVHGGETLEETTKHFCHRFCTSVIRIQSVVLDTQKTFGEIPRDIIHTFASHKVLFLDIPCGTGAAGLAVISVIHELRLAGLIPMLPLEINILAGDFSQSAMDIYQSQMEDLLLKVRGTGIHVTLKTMLWNALELPSTHELCLEWERMALHSIERFVLVANFSGAGTKQFDKLKEAFRHIAVRVSHQNATLLWVEPGEGGGVDFLNKMFGFIATLFARGGRGKEENRAPIACKATMWHPLLNKDLPVKSAIHHYVRPQ